MTNDRVVCHLSNHVDATQAFLFKKRLKIFGKAALDDVVFFDEFLRIAQKQQFGKQVFRENLFHDVLSRRLIIEMLDRILGLVLSESFTVFRCQLILYL